MTTKIGIELPSDLLDAVRIAQISNRNKLSLRELNNKTKKEAARKIKNLPVMSKEDLWKGAVPEYGLDLVLPKTSQRFSFCLYQEAAYETYLLNPREANIFFTKPREYARVYPDAITKLFYSNQENEITEKGFKRDQIYYISNIKSNFSSNQAFLSFDFDYIETYIRYGNPDEIQPGDVVVPGPWSGINLWTILGYHGNSYRTCFLYEVKEILAGDYELETESIWPIYSHPFLTLEQDMLFKGYKKISTVNPDLLPSAIKEQSYSENTYIRRRVSSPASQIDGYFMMFSSQSTSIVPQSIYKNGLRYATQLNSFHNKFTYFATTTDHGSI